MFSIKYVVRIQLQKFHPEAYSLMIKALQKDPKPL